MSGSTRPIYAVFSPNESVLGADDRSGPLFLISHGTLSWQSILWKNGKLPTFVALAFINGMGYHYLNVRINSVNYASISCKNLVNFSSVTPELIELICERQVWYGKKLAYLVDYLSIYLHVRLKLHLANLFPILYKHVSTIIVTNRTWVIRLICNQLLSDIVLNQFKSVQLCPIPTAKLL